MIPAVDVLDGAVVRLTRGSFEDVVTYRNEPWEQVRHWVEQGAGRVHVVDLAGARRGRVDLDLAQGVAGRGLVQMGGGIRDAETASALVGAGIDRVVIGTTAVWDGDELARILDAVGPDRVVAALDVSDGRARGAAWSDEGAPLDGVVRSLVDLGIRRALVTGIHTDGTMQGPDLALISTVRESAPSLQVIASGGVGSAEDVARLASTGAEAVIVGKALYERRLTLAEAMVAAG